MAGLLIAYNNVSETNEDALHPEAALDQLQQVLETHKELIRVQAEANQLKAAELSVEQAKSEAHQRELDLKQRELDLKEQEIERQRQAENARNARFVEVLDRYANLGEQVTGRMQSDEAADAIRREGFEEFSAEVKIIKRGLYALLSRDGGEIQKVKQKLKAEFDREEAQELLIQQRRNLAKLKQREAKFGGQAPLDLLNQIEYVEAEIERLEAELNSN